MSAGIWDIFRVYTCPVRFYGQFDLARPYGWPLALLVLLLAVGGYVVVASGLVDREVDITTEKTLAGIEKGAIGELTRDQLDELLKSARDAAVFWKIIASGARVLAGPAEVIGRIFAGAAVAFVVVALCGRKPAYHGLVAILTFAAYVEVLRQILVVSLMVSLASSDVESSLAALLRGRPAASGWLYAGLQTADPFTIWFYVLAAIGISRSGQLSRRGAIILCTVLWLAGACLHVGARFVSGVVSGEVLT
jgi:hypothetical protein